MKHIEPCRLATACLPWTESGDFLEEVFRREVRALRRSGFENLYIFGTAGEGYAVTDRQFDQIVGAFADEMRQGNAEPMVGVIDGFRWAILPGNAPVYLPGIAISVVVVSLVLASGLWYFRRTERVMADVI
jgi:hypothetical protein